VIYADEPELGRQAGELLGTATAEIDEARRSMESGDVTCEGIHPGLVENSQLMDPKIVEIGWLPSDAIAVLDEESGAFSAAHPIAWEETSAQRSQHSAHVSPALA
jgi:hypothetical protein